LRSVVERKRGPSCSVELRGEGQVIYLNLVRDDPYPKNAWKFLDAGRRLTKPRLYVQGEVEERQKKKGKYDTASRKER